VVIVAVVAAASAGGWWLGRSRIESPTATVVSVVDGDTLGIARPDGRDTVRLLGVDTPETVDPDEPVECYGPEAAAYTRSRLDGRTVRLEFDAERRDRFGRLLAYVMVDGHRFNDELLRGGYATLLIIPPNGRHGRALLDAELEARRAGRGLWRAC
jgi:micrococcal nuclease